MLPIALAGLGAYIGYMSEKKSLPVIPNIPTKINTLSIKTDKKMEERAFKKAKELVIKEEGVKLIVYKDPVFPNDKTKYTVGYGHKVLPSDKLKLNDKITQEQAEKFLESDLKTAFKAAIEQAKELNIYTVGFIARLTSVNFQLGIYWRTKFDTTWGLLKSKKGANIEKAIRNIENSAWASQTPNRADYFINAIRVNMLG